MSRREIGDEGEETACGYMRKNSMEILTRNYRCRGGEIDIIAKDGETIAFVEVKTRTGAKYGTPADAVTRAKMRKIITAAQHYIMLERLTDQNFRFDVAEVTGERGYYSVNYIKSAFEA